MVSLDDMVEQNLVNIGRSHTADVARKSRVDRSEDGDTLGLTENTSEVRVHGSSSGGKSRQITYASESRGDVPRYFQGGGDDLEHLK